MRNQTRDRSNQPRGQYSAKIFLLFALILIACAFVGVAYAAGFSDDFNDGVQDTTWRQQSVFRGSSTQFESRVTVAEQNGQLIITPLSNALDNHYNGYVSVATWGHDRRTCQCRGAAPLLAFSARPSDRFNRIRNQH